MNLDFPQSTWMVAVGGVMLALAIVTLVRIVRAGRGERLERADAIVVFGAAVWANGPSLALRVRVARAAQLHALGWAPAILCTGGNRDGRSEARVMRDLLRDHGVPYEAIIADDGGSSTREALRSAERLGRDRWRRLMAVSSPYHLYRIRREAKRQRVVVVTVAARRPDRATRAQRMHDVRQHVRELVAVAAYAVRGWWDALLPTSWERASRSALRHLSTRARFLAVDADATAGAGESIERIIKGGNAGLSDTTTVLTPASGLHAPVDGIRGSRFGMRHRRLHAGLDIRAPYGAPVAAAADGTVLFAGWIGPYGNVAVIHHGGGLATVYAHLAGFVVAEGEAVAGGRCIGHVGETGRSFGPHLHFEVRVHGSPVDPAVYLPALAQSYPDTSTR